MAEDVPVAEVFEGHKLKEKITVTITGGDDEVSLAAIRRAEEALQELSENFDDWIGEEASRLIAAYDDVAANGYSGDAGEALFRAAHDLKGEAETFGYPYVTRISASLCILLEAVEKGVPAPIDLIGLHIDSIRAILRAEIKGANDRQAEDMFTGLAQATDKFLAANPIAPRPTARNRLEAAARS